jgi:hypothetical protein
MEENTNIKLQCVFCFSFDFIIPNDHNIEAGSMVQCANCLRFNDYDSLLRIAEQKAHEWAEEQLEKEIKRVFKRR